MLDKSRIEYLEKVDPDRYRAALLAAKADRDALHVFYAFHTELAKVPEVVSEPMIGAIRYQWWRDALEEIYSGKQVRQHDIAKPLAHLIESKSLTRFQLDSLINGRARDLDPEPFADVQSAVDYCRETSGRITQIAAAILKTDFAEDAIIDLGTSWGLTGLLRSWRYYHTGMLSKIDFHDLHQAAETLYLKSGSTKIDAAIMPALAYVSLVPGFLNSMTKSGYDPNAMVPEYRPFSKKWRLMKAALTGKI